MNIILRGFARTVVRSHRSGHNHNVPILGFILTLVLCVPSLAAAERPDAEALAELDEYVETFMSEHQIPGVLYALADDGELLLVRPHGLADVELGVPVSADSVFEIGSISKQFVSATVMLLAEEGKLAIDDTIETYLPEIPSEWYGVTIRQLLTHTSGIPDYEEIRTYDVYRFRLTPEEVIRIAHSRPMDFPPGTGWYYSNTGYFLLSRIVERVEGKPLGEVLHSRIFGPLGMTRTRLADPEAIIRDRVSGYWVGKTGTLINRLATETSSTLGAGGLLSSARDLALWDEALDGDALLSAASKKEMWMPGRLSNGELPRRLNGQEVEYGFGWVVSPQGGHPKQSHWGQVAGFTAHFARFPDRDLAVIVFMNRYQAGAGPMVDRIVNTLVPGLDEEEE